MNRSRARHSLARIGRALHRFRMAERGVAAVEFALILPFLLTLYIGSVEVSSAITVDKRISTVAGALGDLVARTDGQLTNSALNDYFIAAKATMAPYPSTGVRQIVSCVQVKTDGSTNVVWSRSTDATMAHTVGQPYPNIKSTDAIVAVAKGQFVIVSEASYTYTPLFGYVFPSDFNLYHEYFHLPRNGGQITIEAQS